jgi:hypothetical protein
MSETRSSLDWRMLYVAAMLESDSAQLPLRIETADAANAGTVGRTTKDILCPFGEDRITVRARLLTPVCERALTSEDQNCL